jgi:hypothetical protein
MCSGTVVAGAHPLVPPPPPVHTHIANLLHNSSTPQVHDRKWTSRGHPDDPLCCRRVSTLPSRTRKGREVLAALRIEALGLVRRSIERFGSDGFAAHPLLDGVILSTDGDIAALVLPLTSTYSTVDQFVLVDPEAGLLLLRNQALDGSQQVKMVPLRLLAVSAMSLHPADVFIQRAGLAFLRNLSFQAENAVCMMEHRSVVVEAIVTHAHDPEVQETAVRILFNLALIPGNKVPMLSQRLVATTAVANHPDFAGVQHYGRWLLDSIPRSSVEAFVHASAALQTHFENPTLIHEVLGVLAECSGGMAGPLWLLPSVISVMEKHPKVPGVQEAGLCFIQNLGLEPMNLPSLMAKVDYVLRVMSQHCDVGGVQAAGLGILRNLATEASLQGPLGVRAPLVVSLLTAHLDVSSVQAAGLGFLQRLALDPECRVGLMSHWEIAVRGLVAHPHKALTNQGSRSCGRR